MSGHRFLVLTIALLMVTAGCLGGGGESDASVDSDTDTDSDADAGSSGGAAGGSGSGDADSGVGASGGSDGGELELTDTEAALRDAGSFTVVWTYSGVDRSGSEIEVTHEYYADLAAERSLTVTSSMRDGESDAGTMQQFFADGTTRVRSGTEESPTYFSFEQESADVVATALALSQARAYGADDNLQFEGRETFDGVAVERYELSEADSQLIQAGSAASVGTANPGDVVITDFRYVVLVDDDGLSRFESWSFSGETSDGQVVTGKWEYSLTNVGSTTVEDPDWLSEA
jgi:hypothetical protein